MKIMIIYRTLSNLYNLIIVYMKKILDSFSQLFSRKGHE